MQKINVMPISLKVRNINAFKYKLDKFALTTLYIPSLFYEGSEIYICSKCKLYLVDNLKLNMLIGNNIFYTENFSINFASSSSYIQSYSINIIINAEYYTQYLKYRLLVNAATFILLESEDLVLFK